MNGLLGYQSVFAEPFVLHTYETRSCRRRTMAQPTMNELWSALAFIRFVEHRRRSGIPNNNADCGQCYSLSRHNYYVPRDIVKEMANNSHACIYYDVHVCWTKLALTVRDGAVRMTVIYVCISPHLFFISKMFRKSIRRCCLRCRCAVLSTISQYSH